MYSRSVFVYLKEWYAITALSKSRGICRVLLNGRYHVELKVAETTHAKSREICKTPAQR